MGGTEGGGEKEVKEEGGSGLGMPTCKTRDKIGLGQMVFSSFPEKVVIQINDATASFWTLDPNSKTETWRAACLSLATKKGPAAAADHRERESKGGKIPALLTSPLKNGPPPLPNIPQEEEEEGTAKKIKEVVSDLPGWEFGRRRRGEGKKSFLVIFDEYDSSYAGGGGGGKGKIFARCSVAKMFFFHEDITLSLGNSKQA